MLPLSAPSDMLHALSPTMLHAITPPARSNFISFTQARPKQPHLQCRYLSHFRSIHRGAFFATLRTTAVRKLMPESWGFLCPVHTPDGAPCGLLNHLAADCRIITWPVEDAAATRSAITQVPANPVDSCMTTCRRAQLHMSHNACQHGKLEQMVVPVMLLAVLCRASACMLLHLRHVCCFYQAAASCSGDTLASSITLLMRIQLCHFHSAVNKARSISGAKR